MHRSDSGVSQSSFSTTCHSFSSTLVPFSGAKKKKKLQSNSHGEEELKHDKDKVNLEDGSQNLHMTIEPPKKGLWRSSSSSSSNSSSSEEKSPAVQLVKETDSFPNDQVIENFPGTEDTSALLQDMITSSLILLNW
ncbi:hypothetical protein K7X08_032636 [Anisodus acutangulus]|uniref:Uncharacterized protein n=1 Tax=Anisodus acutangulus TaxID=402998 RepID=A0A9Q1M0H3_9SOLA|nr:hypothetical protein K7X08_032636 [Anisodus acutangulus]